MRLQIGLPLEGIQLSVQKRLGECVVLIRTLRVEVRVETLKLVAEKQLSSLSLAAVTHFLRYGLSGVCRHS